MDFKIIPHVNVTYSPKQVRQVTHILRRVLNFSITRKINSPHSYIQLSVTSNKSSTQRNTKPKHQAVLSCPWPVPLEPALTGEATACGSPIHICSPSFLTSPCHRPVFVAFFFFTCSFRHYGICSSSAVVHFTSHGIDTVLIAVV